MAEGQLRRSGVRVPIQAQPLKLLALLAGRPRRRISRDEIRRHLWGEHVHVDAEQGINFSIRRIRQALGDSASTPRFIETVPREGYRFLAEVEEIGGKDRPARQGSPGGAVPEGGWRLRTAVAASLLLMLLAVWSLEALRNPERRAAEGPGRTGAVSTAEPGKAGSLRPRILVLPFEGLGTGPGAEGGYLGSSVAEEVIRALGRERGGVLEVMAMSTVRRLDESEVSPEALGVDFLVDGRVEPSTTTPGLRVHARLVAVEGLRQLWSNAYETPRVTALPRVAERIARAVVLQFCGEPGDSLRLALSRRPEAYAAYLEGRELLGRWLHRYGPGSEDQVRRARRLLESAVGLDPGFAPTYVELARLHLWRRGMTETESWARRALLTALALDEQLEDAHVGMASLALYWDLDLEAARRSLERALELSADHPLALRRWATLLLILGRHEEAVEVVYRYRALDPLAVLTAPDSIWHLYVAGRLEAARRIGREAVEADGRCLACLRTLVLLALQQGNPVEASSWARREMELSGAGDVAERTAAAADPAAALAAYWRWRLATAPVPSSQTDRAALHLALGQRGAALDLLELAVWDREDWIRVYLRYDPRFDPLRGEPRFEAVLERLFG